MLKHLLIRDSQMVIQSRKSVPLLAILLVCLSTVSVSAQRRSKTVDLFNGKDLSGWVTAQGEAVTAGWDVVDGMLKLTGKGGGNIFTDRKYADFDLEFEWKIPVGGNNGVKYRVREYDGAILGIEYQLLDDSAHKFEKSSKQSCGSIYAIKGPSIDKVVKSFDGFNHSRIVVRRNHITHYLNGAVICEQKVGNRDWDERIAQSKFKDRKDFGENKSGLIMLTEHGNETYFRNIRLTPLGRQP